MGEYFDKGWNVVVLPGFVHFDGVLLLLFVGGEGERFHSDLLSPEGSGVAFEDLDVTESGVADLVEELEIVFEVGCG